MKKKTIQEKNFLKLKPDIAKQWDYEKNGNLRPEDFSVGSSRKKIWWKCSKGHSWKTSIASRTTNGNGCPICSNRMILENYNDLKTRKPELAKEWNYEKNGDLKPTQVGTGSNKKVWWKCSKGHEFEGRINDRANKGHGCPVCSNRIIIPGINDLKTLRPDLAAEWDKWRNKLKPTEVAIGSNKKVWWVCYKGHRWEARVNDRKRGTGCPICARKRKQTKRADADDLKIMSEKSEKNL